MYQDEEKESDKSTFIVVHSGIGNLQYNDCSGYLIHVGCDGDEMAIREMTALCSASSNILEMPRSLLRQAKQTKNKGETCADRNGEESQEEAFCRMILRQ